jgi:hypothetical protein
MVETIEMPRGPRPARAGQSRLGRCLGAWTGAALVLPLWAGSCSPKERGRFLTPEYTGDLVGLYAKAKLPKDAKKIYGYRMAGQSLTIHVRFSCTAQQLQSFLEASPVIPNLLQDDFRPFQGPKEHIPFWRPHALTDVRGVQTRWYRNGDEVGFLLMTGRDPKGELPIVYMLFVIEHLASR